MICNLNEVKRKLISNQDVLLDGGYLEMDMKVIYDYLKTQKIRSSEMDRYFSNNEDFNFLEFTKQYLASLVGREVTLSYTTDEWLQIK